MLFVITFVGFLLTNLGFLMNDEAKGRFHLELFIESLIPVHNFFLAKKVWLHPQDLRW